MKKVNCPQCGKETLFSEENKYRPFCSHRCKLIDLGEWAEEKYTVPSQEAPSSEEFEKIIGEQDDTESN